MKLNSWLAVVVACILLPGLGETVWTGPDAYLTRLVCTKVGNVGPTALTTFVPKAKTEVEAKYVLRTAGGTQCLLCSRPALYGTSAKYIFFAEVSGKPRIDMYTASTSASRSNVAGDDVTLSITNQLATVAVAGVEPFSFGAAFLNYTPTCPLRLFASCEGSSSKGSINDYFTGTFTSLRFYEWEGTGASARRVRLADYQPAVVNNVTGLWDRVSHTFLASTSSVGFNGEGVRANYIEVDANDETFAPASGYGVVDVTGSSITLTAPANPVSADGRTRGTCLGWKLYASGIETPIRTSADDGEIATSCTIAYSEPLRLVWEWKVEYKVTATASQGCTVTPTEQWVAWGGAATLAVTTEEDYAFAHWIGEGLWGVACHETNTSFTIYGPVEVGTKIGRRHPIAAGASIAEALASEEVQDGDTLVLETGNYPQSASLSVARDVVIESASGNAADVTISRTSGKTGFSLVKLNHEYAFLRNLTICSGYYSKYNGKPANLYIDTNGGTADNCIIRDGQNVEGYDCKGGGVGIYSAKGAISRCVVKGNKNTQWGAAGLYMTAGLAVNCLFTGNTTGANSAGTIYMTDGTLLNCTIAGNTGKDLAGVSVTGGTVRNCIICENTQTGTTDAQKAVYNGTASCFDHCLAPILINDTCVQGAALFVDLAGGNVRLSLGSDAIDAGLDDVQALKTDLYAFTRVLGDAIDIGCAEYNVFTPSVVLAATVTTGTYPLTTVFSADIANVTDWASCAWDFDGDGTVDEVTSTKSVSHVYDTYASGVQPTVTLLNAQGQEIISSQNTVPISTYPAVLYVNDKSATPSVPYDATTNAAKSIATAFGIAGEGSVIIVETGTYAVSELLVDKGVTIRSRTGQPEDVILTPATGVLRPFTLNHADALITGFAISGFSNGQNYNRGHGVYVDSKGGTASNCVFRGCSVGGMVSYGAAVCMYGPGLITHCVITNCTATQAGDSKGGSAVYMENGTVRNTLMAGNGYPSSESAAKSDWGTVSMSGGRLENCTLAGNAAKVGCGGIYATGGTVVNCVSAGNTTESATAGAAAWQGTASCFSHCVTDTATPINETCVSSMAPFVSVGSANYHLAPGSAAIDFAEELGWMKGAKDLDGNDRIRNEIPDAGCYEAAPPTFGASVAALGPSEGFAPYSVDIRVTPVAGSDQGYTLKWYEGAAAEPFLVTNVLEWTYSTSVVGNHNLMLTIIDDETGKEFTTESPLVLYAAPRTLYVAAKEEATVPEHPYATPETAAPNLATAYGAALEGATVVMKCGIHEADAQLDVNKRLVIAGETDDPADTKFHYKGSDGRLFNLKTAGALVCNLSLDGGFRRSGNYPESGNLIAMSANAVVSNCVLRNGQAYAYNSHGAAVNMSAGVLSHCVLTNNRVRANSSGIAVHMTGGRLENCLLAFNYCGLDSTSVPNGGTVRLDGAGAEVVNCTIVSNTYSGCAGVSASAGRVVNTIIAANVSTYAEVSGEAAVWNGSIDSFDHCASDVASTEGHFVCGDLKFRNVAKGDWRIRAGSAAHDIGDKTAVREATDMSGRPRVFGGKVDAGCYECPSGGFSVIVR